MQGATMILRNPPVTFLCAFAFLFPLVTGQRAWIGNWHAFWTLLAAAVIASLLLWFRVRREPLAWHPSSRAAAIIGLVALSYATALLAATHGLSRPAIFFFLPVALGLGAVLLRPEFLETRLPRRTRLCLTVLIIVAGISCLITSHQHVALAGSDYRRTGFLTLLSCAVLFLLVAVFVQTGNARQRIIAAAVSSSAVVSIIALWQFFDPGKSAQGWFLDLQTDPRPPGTIGQTNWFGTYLCLILPLSVAMHLDTRSRLIRGGALLFSTLLFSALLVAQTRGAWLAAGCFLLWIAFSHRLRLQKILPLFAAFALTAAILLPCKNWEIYRRTMSINKELSHASKGSPDAGTGRFRFWAYAFRHLPPHLLLGAGLDTYKEVGAQDKIPPPRTDKAHSLYIEYALTLGLPGLALYLAFLLSCATPAGTPWELRASLFTYLIQGIFIHDTIQTWPLVWIIAGLAVCRPLLAGEQPVTAR